MSEIINKATLEYTSNDTPLTATSNTASITLQGPVSLGKSALEETYQIGEELVYTIVVKNTSPYNYSGITIEDNLGTYKLNEEKNITPLNFVNPAALFEDEEYVGPIIGSISEGKDKVTFSIETLSAGHSIMIHYKAIVNQYATSTVGTSQIKNTVTASCDAFINPIIATYTVPVSSYANLSIDKSMSPDPVIDGGEITYTFRIRNYGNRAADEVVLKDAFLPVPTDLHVSVDGVTTEDYNHDSGAFRYPKTDTTSPYSIAAATFTQDTETGLVSITPKTSTIIIKGSL